MARIDKFSKKPVAVKKKNDEITKFKIVYLISQNLIWKCSWCNGYRRRKWTRRHKFQSWTRQIAFSHSTNTLGKGMNPIILPPVNLIVGQTRFFSLGKATSLEGKQ